MIWSSKTDIYRYYISGQIIVFIRLISILINLQSFWIDESLHADWHLISASSCIWGINVSNGLCFIWIYWWELRWTKQAVTQNLLTVDCVHPDHPGSGRNTLAVGEASCQTVHLDNICLIVLCKWSYMMLWQWRPDPRCRHSRRPHA